MPSFGAYPVADAQVAGTELSSTYEGRHLQLTESDLTHPTHADGFVDKGDPVVCGEIVGVSFDSAAAATDQVAIDTEGIWILDVVASDDNGNSAVAGGDEVFINTTTAVLSKIRNAATQRPFGYALGVITAGQTNTIAVKVHFDPRNQWMLDGEVFYYGTDREASLTHVVTDTQGKLRIDIALAAGAMDDGYGAWEVNLNMTGAWTGHAAASSSWANLASGVTIVAGNYVCARNDGVYEDAGATITNAKIIFGARMHAILGDWDAKVFPFSVNTGNNAITALIDVPNFTDLGVVVDAGADTGTLWPVMANAAGTLKYCKLYDHT